MAHVRCGHVGSYSIESQHGSKSCIELRDDDVIVTLGRIASAHRVSKRQVVRLTRLDRIDGGLVWAMVRAVVCGEAELQTSQCRAYLAAVIIWLAGQDAQQAYLCNQVPLFVSFTEKPFTNLSSPLCA